MKFNIFSQKTKPSNDWHTGPKTVDVVVVQPSIEQQIHNDVYSAQEELLKEAQRILGQAPVYDTAKHKRMRGLKELGFNQAQEVSEYYETQKRIEEHEKRKVTIEDYKQRYPLNKFIDEKSVKVVCDKYGLLLTDVGAYIAEIPEKNQNEIINFRVCESDLDNIHSGWFMPQGVFNSRGMSARQSQMDYAAMFMRSRFNDEPLQYEVPQYVMGVDPIQPDKNQKVKGEGLKIVAPVHKLSTQGREKRGHKLEIKDPIVLQPVKGGYLIVSSWGLEASDPLVVNEINN